MAPSALSVHVVVPSQLQQMYALFLTVHSWVRWALVLVAAVVFVRSLYAFSRNRPYAPADKRFAEGFVGLLNLQFVLGLTLYVFLSPLVRAGLSDVGAAMASSPVRFFVIEHQVAALIAIGIGHAGLSRAKRAGDDRSRHRCVLWGAGGCLLVILIAIPWPFLPYGRVLFRL